MRIEGKEYRTIWFEKKIVKIIDQTKLPHQFIIKDLKTVNDVINAIKVMDVRGAPLIGATAAYGLVLSIIENNDQRNKMQCSTHPHSTYFQILSDVGIFGFLIIFIFLCHIIGTIFKMLFKIKKEDRYFLSYYFMNIGMLINLFPLIPSGSFFNNWICLMISYLFGFWLFLKNKYLKVLKLNLKILYKI